MFQIKLNVAVRLDKIGNIKELILINLNWASDNLSVKESVMQRNSRLMLN